MKSSIQIVNAIVLCLGVGCASFSTTQSERRSDAETLITTKVSARTLWEAKSALANFKAMQSDKTQSASVGSLNQESNSTNAVQVLNAIKGILESIPK